MKKLLVLIAAVAFAAVGPRALATDHQVSIEIEKNTQANSLVQDLRAPELAPAGTMPAVKLTAPSDAIDIDIDITADAEGQDADKRSKPGGAKRASAEPVAFHRLL